MRIDGLRLVATVYGSPRRCGRCTADVIGQLILFCLMSESYGLFVIAVDLFATLFLLLDLGLPTLLARWT